MGSARAGCQLLLGRRSHRETAPGRAALFAVAVALAGCDGGGGAERVASPASPVLPTHAAGSDGEAGMAAGEGDLHYVGSAACVECHPAAAREWAGSDHDLAMQEPNAAAILGDFADARFESRAIRAEFTRSGDGATVRVAAESGPPTDFSVRYTFGADPLQQYLVELPGGRLQAFPVAWDVERARWFTLYPEAEAAGEHALDWTGPALNWNRSCAECHSTNLRRGYDEATGTYATTWTDLDVGCEACHGPASAHVAWARSHDSNGRGRAAPPSLGLVAHLGVPAISAERSREALAARDRGTQTRQVEVCARCHAHRRPLHPDDRPDRPLLDAWIPSLLRPDLYHADGQVLGEVYEYGSFVQSRMFHEGVVCTDCHDAHSLRLRREGNALCAQCHEPAAYDTSAHTHHAPGSPASACVACHMRASTFMQIDERRDHGFHVPRPDLTVAAGVPNACNDCHTEPASWARDRVAEWFGPDRLADGRATLALAAGRRGDPAAEPELAAVAGDVARSFLVRATAIDLLRGYRGAAAAAAIRRGLDDAHPLVRGVAIEAFQGAPADELVHRLPPLLDDPSRYVRTEAARVLAQAGAARLAGLPRATAARFESVLEEFREGQLAAADQAPAHLNLAVLHQNLGEESAALRRYERAIALDPTFYPARFNLAMLHVHAGRRGPAEHELREVIRLAPTTTAAHLALGRLLAEDPARTLDASAALAEAARLAPGEARIQVEAGLASLRSGRRDEAEALLRRALEVEPGDPRALQALAALAAADGRWDDALAEARRIRSRADSDRLVEAIERERAKAQP